MYNSFELNDIERFILALNPTKINSYKRAGKNYDQNIKKSIRTEIEKFYLGNNKEFLDGDLIMQNWFPQVESHIFISHSHLDIESIFIFAGFLQIEFNIKSFIDSSIWGYADELLKNIDNDHCYNNLTKNYSYEKRNITTSNVYLMLSNSLSNMLDNTECVIFVNTPNSVKKINEQMKDKTYSPWIFSELNMIEKMRIRIPIRKLTKEGELRHFEKSARSNVIMRESLNVVYGIEDKLKSLDKITFANLLIIKKMTSLDDAEKNLDKIYSICGARNE